MIDRLARNQLAQALRAFAAGLFSNDEFEIRIPVSNDPAIWHFHVDGIWSTPEHLSEELESMTSLRACSTFQGHLAMFAAIFFGTTLFMALDVELAMARIDPNDSSTWPNMVPVIRYMFIPVVAGGLAGAAAIVNWLMSLVDRRRIRTLTHWALLGASYSLVASALPFRYLGLNFDDAFSGSAVVALGCAALIRYRFGESRGENAS